MNKLSKTVNLFRRRQFTTKNTHVALASLFVALVCLTLVCTEGWREWNGYCSAIQDTKLEASELARSLAQHADDTFNHANAYLLGLIERTETDGVSPRAIQRLNAYLAHITKASPQINKLFVLDEEGNWLASSNPGISKSLNYKDRDYFQHFKNSSETSVFLGAPVISRSGGEWVLTVARPWHHPDGSFAGVVLASIAASYFSDFYASFGLGQQFSIALYRENGEQMSRFPFDETYIGRQSQIFSRHMSTSQAGNFSYLSPVDNVERIGGFYKGHIFPITVLVGKAKHVVLADWRGQALGRIGSVLALISLITCLGGWIIMQTWRQQEIANALAESELTFRMLTEGSMDNVTRIGLDGRRLYVSLVSKQMLGWAPEELIGKPVFDNIHPNDRKRVRQVYDELPFGDRQETTLQYRAVHRNGSIIWIEADVRLAFNSDGQANGFVSVTRDVTERVRSEAQLAKMARTDALTGIANRRAFDDDFDAELRRAKRSGDALSLLLLDVDHFKMFNDAYGHQEGDRCLQEIAIAALGVVNRAGDLVARYGGEEFAILLPNTGEQAAFTIGEELRRAIEALAIQHMGNPPASRVTASIGCATLFPTMPNCELVVDSKVLIKAADAALYRAKQKGRNQVIVSPDMFRFGFENTKASADANQPVRNLV